MPTATSLASVTSRIECKGREGSFGEFVTVAVPTTTAGATSVWYKIPLACSYGTLQQVMLLEAGTSANWAMYFHQADNSAIGSITNIYSKTSLGTSLSNNTGVNVRFCNTTEGESAIYVHVVESGSAQATGIVALRMFIDYKI